LISGAQGSSFAFLIFPLVRFFGGLYNKDVRKITIDVRHPSQNRTVKQEVLLDTRLNFDYSNLRWVALDTETLGLDIHRDPVCCVQVASADEKSKTGVRTEILYTYQENPDYSKLKGLISNPKIEKIVHVSIFDIPRIENLVKVEIQGRVWDTKIMSRVGRSNSPHHGLSELLKEFCGVKKEDEGHARDWALSYKSWSEAQIKYAAIDVLYLYEVKERLLERVKRA